MFDVIDEGAIYIINGLNKNNYEAYLVGGCVRDMILQKKPEDFDVATSASPDEVKSIFKKTIDTGIQHGTVTVRVNNKSYEVTTYRIDGEYKDNRRPSNVKFTCSLENDLARRDFTMNAIAYHPQIGFVDPFDGQGDINRKIIKAVGEPGQRFNEDALRILRAVRFSVQLGFDISPPTIKSAIENAHLIKNLSTERIRDEFFKTIQGRYFDKFKLFAEFAPYIDVGLAGYIKENMDNIVKYAPLCGGGLTGLLAMFFYNYPPDKTESLLKALKASSSLARSARLVLEAFHTPALGYTIRKAAGIAGYEHFEITVGMHMSIAEAEGGPYMAYAEKLSRGYDSVKLNGPPITLKDLDINGGDLHGVAEGKLMGWVLKYLMGMVLKYPFYNKKSLLMALAKRYVEKAGPNAHCSNFI
ncbi:MAG: CCA tRNA nucleotidyltransferase [Clostridiales bacterium]|jgi:tRNA nucleotidyltransferase (CCA-adding enzyme)|nr:CCA tRNA nucleotidyltransferase [Clostridiales bacterium]